MKLKPEILYTKLKRVSAEASWIAIAQCSALMCNVFVIKYLTTTVGTSGYGIYALGVTIAGIASMLVYGPIAQTVLRFARQSFEESQYPIFLKILIRTQSRLSLALVAFAVLAYLAFPSRFSIGLSLGIALLSISEGINRSLNSLSNSFRYRSKFAIQKIIESISKTIFILLALLISTQTGETALAGLIVGIAISAVINLRIYAKSEHITFATINEATPSKKIVNEMLSYGLAFPVYAVFGVIFSFSDRLIIEHNLGLESLGTYFAIYQLSSAPATVLSIFLSQLMAPILFSQFNSGQNPLLQSIKILAVYSLLYLPIILLVIHFPGQILSTFTNHEIAATGNLVFVFASIGLFLFNLGQLALLYGQALKKTQSYIASKAIHSITFFLSCWILVDEYGLEGIALSLIMSSTLYLVINICISLYHHFNLKNYHVQIT